MARKSLDPLLKEELTKGPQSKKNLFNHILECGEDVQQLVHYVVREWRKQNTAVNEYTYVTRAELLERYKDKKVVDTIISQKYASGMWRSHPDSASEDLHQFWCVNVTRLPQTEPCAGALNVNACAHTCVCARVRA